MTGHKRFLLTTIRKRQLQFFLAFNQSRWTRKANIEWKDLGTKSIGRQRTKYTDSLNNFVTRKESRNNELIMITDDRECWKAMIVDVCNSPGT